ncbi:MAG: DUF72 domain-containing protein [Luteolibacter sp.]
MSPPKMLAFYASEFRSTEVNHTFRSLPGANTIDRWRDGYTDREIQDLAHFIRNQAGKWSAAFVYYKHEETAAGPEFARNLMEALKD